MDAATGGGGAICVVDAGNGVGAGGRSGAGVATVVADGARAVRRDSVSPLLGTVVARGKGTAVGGSMRCSGVAAGSGGGPAREPGTEPVRG